MSDFKPREVGYDLKTPCNDCPFRTDADFHSGIIKSLPDLAENYKKDWFMHSCHKTDPRADGYKEMVNGKTQHCVGSIIMNLKEKDDITFPMVIYGKIDKETYAPKLDMSAPVFDSMDQMVSKYIELGDKEKYRRKTFTTEDGMTISIRSRRV